MTRTLLAKKAGDANPVTKDDNHWNSLASDPSFEQIPSGTTYGTDLPQSKGPTMASSTTTIVQQNNQPILTAAGDNAAQNAEVLLKHSKESGEWMNNKWRPMMAWMYMMVCIFDFMLFPIMFTIVQFWEIEAANDAFRQWQPLTLQGAGLFHMAMGAVLGIAAFGRTKEKLESKQ